MSADAAQEFVDELLRADRDEIVRGFCRGFANLDAASGTALLSEMAGACRNCFLRRADFPDGLTLEGLIERLETAGPHRIEIRRVEKEIIWSELLEGRCACPLVRLGTVPLCPRLCDCAVEWLRGLIEKYHGGNVTVELVESVAGGSQSCVFRVKLGAAP
ncbi:MAG: hypothetical protein QME71_03925 [Dehalococcoidia bacterium]|nr:hypothetical protein [Dehalococcoidia bacterium]